MLKRSVLYVRRNSTRTLLLFIIFLLVTTFSLSGLAVMGASEDTSAELRGTTGASFTIERNLATGGTNSQGGGMSYNTQEYVTDEMIKEISKTNGVKAYNAKYRGGFELHDNNDNPMEMIKYSSKWDKVGLNYSCTGVGSFFSEYDSMFLSNKFELIEGRHLTNKDKKSIIISDSLAKKHNLKVGDQIYLYRDSWTTGAADAGDDAVEVNITGIFKIIEEQPDKNSTVPYDLYENFVYANMGVVKDLTSWVDFEPEREGYEYADFYVSDPERLETIVQNVQKINSIEWNNFNTTVNDEVYQRSASSMSNVESLIRTMIIIIIAISMGIITLILTMWIKGRMRETGILMAVGISKKSIITQHMIETIIIAAVAFAASWAASPAVARILGTVFNPKLLRETIIVGAADFIAVYGVGSILLLLSVIISSLPIIRLKPSEVLSKLD